jgi:hypothetical protein
VGGFANAQASRGGKSRSVSISIESTGYERIWSSRPMPVLATFYGMIIRVYFYDHAPPHFHVEYAEHRAVFEIASGKLLGGGLPQRSARMVATWRRLHIAELRAAWQAASAGEMPDRIPPLS